MQKTVAVMCSCAVALAGCATASKDIATTYVTPMQYQNYDCAQLAAEIQRIQTRVVELGGRLDQAATNDKAIMGVGLILFWPALFALGGTKQQEAEYGRLKGEYEALQQASVAKKCSGMVAGSSNGVEIRTVQGTIAAPDVEKRLQLLAELREKGILTDAEFNAKRSEVIDSALTASATPAPAASASSSLSQPGSRPTGVVGLRFRIRDTDTMTRLTSGEALITVDAVTDRGTSLNGGAILMDPSGKAISGAILLPHIEGLGGTRLQSGLPITAWLRPNGRPAVEVQVRMIRMESMRIGDRDVSLIRCAVSGNAERQSGTGSQPFSSSWSGAEIKGEVLVEPTTGLVVAGSLNCRHPYYSLNRAVVQ